MNSTPYPRITPWVGRLIIANAVVLLLMLTVFTSPALQSRLVFDPAHAFARPWTFVTYMFVHAGLLHLLGNMLMLFVFGAAVEHRMGSRAFLLYYLYCGVGAALFALGLSSLTSVPPFLGASGAILGLGLAFATFWPDAELILFPFPIPVRARTFVAILAGLDVIFALRSGNTDGIAHIAHIGGLAAGFLYFRVQSLSRRGPAAPPRPVERVVMVQSGVPEASHPMPAAPVQPRRHVEADPVAAEVDRVLDKISAQGLGSLTPAERRFLDEVAKQKKQDH